MNVRISDEVEIVALRRSAPRAAAQAFARKETFTTLVPPLVRGGVVAARQPLPNKA